MPIGAYSPLGEADYESRVAVNPVAGLPATPAESGIVPPTSSTTERLGRPGGGVVGIIERNVRVPVKLLGDFRAQVASLETGEHGIAELIARYGEDGMKGYFAALLDYGER